MGLTAAEYLLQLQALLPPGIAWPRDEEAELTGVLSALAEEYARIDARIDDLVEEADPRTTSEMLSDWERIARLPEPYVTVDQTIEERRQALVAKLTMLGAQDPGYYIDLAAKFGLVITITEFRPFRAGKSKAGDPCYSRRVRALWQINHPDLSETRFKVGSRAGERLNRWTGPAVIFYIARYAQAHTRVFFGNGTRRI